MKDNWVPTYSGKRFKLEVTIDPAMIDIDDIAHSLSMQCRFNGHTREFYSVAEHSLIMSFMVSDEAALYALLHDAAETYIGDIIAPLKTDEMRECEEGIMAVILSRFGLRVSDEIVAEVKRADMRMLATEVQQLMYPGHHYPELRGIEPYTLQLRTWSPRIACSQFKDRYDKLIGKV